MEAESRAPGAVETDRKAVFFCPDCGHRSPVDGDWTVAERETTGGRERVYACPACAATVVARPLFGARVA